MNLEITLISENHSKIPRLIFLPPIMVPKRWVLVQNSSTEVKKGLSLDTNYPSGLPLFQVQLTRETAAGILRSIFQIHSILPESGLPVLSNSISVHIVIPFKWD